MGYGFPVSGSGTSVLDIAVEANGLQTEREAVVTVVCGGEQRTFTLRQEAAPAPAGYDKWKQDHFADGTPDEQMAPDAPPRRRRNFQSDEICYGHGSQTSPAGA